MNTNPTPARPSIGALVVVIALAGTAGFAAGRVTTSLDARVAAAGVAKAEADRCVRLVDRPIAFTAEGAADRLIVEAVGPTCDKAAALVLVTKADGAVALAEAYAVSPDQVAAALSTPLPAWPESGAPEGVSPRVERALWEKVRAGGLPILEITGPNGVALFAFVPEAGASVRLGERTS